MNTQLVKIDLKEMLIVCFICMALITAHTADSHHLFFWRFSVINDYITQRICFDTNPCLYDRGKPYTLPHIRKYQSDI